MDKNWLIEIKISHTYKHYEEVIAEDEMSAKKDAYAAFMRKCTYEPSTRLRLRLAGVMPWQCKVSDAVSF